MFSADEYLRKFVRSRLAQGRVINLPFPQLLAPLEEAPPQLASSAVHQDSLNALAHQLLPLRTLAKPVTVNVVLPRRRLPPPAWASLSAAQLMAALPDYLSRGARVVYGILHRVAVAVAQARRYQVIPSSVTFHLPQSLVAAFANYSTRHLRRLIAELERAGLIDSGAHASTVKTMDGQTRRLWDGTLWCVRLSEAQVYPKLHPEEWQYLWRDFQGDLERNHTAKKIIAEEMSALQTSNDMEKALYILQQWAVDPSFKDPPLALDGTSPNKTSESMQDTIYALPMLSEVAPQERNAAVDRAAGILAYALSDGHSHKKYCLLIWTALTSGTLGVLSAQLERLRIDIAEWPGLRKPGALLVKRMQGYG